MGNFHKVAHGRFADIIYGTWMPQEAQRKLMPYLPWAASKLLVMLSTVTSKEMSD